MMPKDSASAGNDQRWAAVGGDVVIATSLVLGGSVVAYDAATGVERWRHSEFGPSLFLPAVDGSVAYVDHGWVFASYDVNTGAVRWANPPSVFGNPATFYKGTPIIAGDRIFVAGSDASYALRR
jgi:outer membrane protein assembly factor BamB